MYTNTCNELAGFCNRDPEINHLHNFLMMRDIDNYRTSTRMYLTTNPMTTFLPFPTTTITDLSTSVQPIFMSCHVGRISSNGSIMGHTCSSDCPIHSHNTSSNNIKRSSEFNNTESALLDILKHVEKSKRIVYFQLPYESNFETEINDLTIDNFIIEIKNDGNNGVICKISSMKTELIFPIVQIQSLFNIKIKTAYLDTLFNIPKVLDYLMLNKSRNPIFTQILSLK